MLDTTFAACELHDVYSSSATVAAGASITPDITKLAALGRKTKRVGSSTLVPRLMGLVLRPLYGATIGTTDGTLSGYRWHEQLDIQITPDGWPVDFWVNMNASEIRRLCIMKFGHNVFFDPAALTAADGAKSYRGMVFIPCVDPDGDREKDPSVDLLALGRGSMQVAVRAIGSDGLTAEQITGLKIFAAYYWDHPGHPVFHRMSALSIQNQFPGGRLSLAGRRIKHAWLQGRGNCHASTATHLPPSFDETVTAQLWLNGEQRIEDVPIEQLIDLHNMHLSDAADFESTTVPQIVPLISAYGKAPRTDLPIADRDARIEFSAEPRDAASTTGVVRLCVEETFPAEKGTSQFGTYARAVGLDPDGVYHKVAASKNQSVDPAKRDALPWRAKLSGA